MLHFDRYGNFVCGGSSITHRWGSVVTCETTVDLFFESFWLDTLLFSAFPFPNSWAVVCVTSSAQVLTKGFGFHLRDLCNTTPLEEFVHIADHNVSRLTQEIICKSSSDWLNKAQSHFLSNLDFFKPIWVSGQKRKNTVVCSIHSLLPYCAGGCKRSSGWSSSSFFVLLAMELAYPRFVFLMFFFCAPCYLLLLPSFSVHLPSTCVFWKKKQKEQTAPFP